MQLVAGKAVHLDQLLQNVFEIVNIKVGRRRQQKQARATRRRHDGVAVVVGDHQNPVVRWNQIGHEIAQQGNVAGEIKLDEQL